MILVLRDYGIPDITRQLERIATALEEIVKNKNG